jgi:hypothetical protein
VLGDFVRRFLLPTRKYKAKTPVHLANGQRVMSSTYCEIYFELARHEFQWTFYDLRELRGGDVVLGVPRLDNEQATLHFGTTRVFTVMDDTKVGIQGEERRPECLLMSSNKVQNKLVYKTR